MLRSDFYYDLPEELIAQYPCERRSASRLLSLNGNSGALRDGVIGELPDLLQPGDLLVFNDTRVIPARLYGRKRTGGKVEILVERVLDGQRVLAQVRAGKALQPGSEITVDGEIVVTVLGRRENFFELNFATSQPLLDILERYGHIPLPPYIARSDTVVDAERYQTVYARRPGAVAAPTAGLHFDASLLMRLRARGIAQTFITLHVGAGTFQPVRVQHIEDHVIHSEFAEVSPQVCEQIQATRARGGRIVAIGTTVVRSLEAACQHGEIRPLQEDVRLFLYPGYQFQCVDILLTNFHLPESTLLMLVAAFAGQENIMHAYRHAIAQRYRFYSYGDAMLITRRVTS
jgi:S-adenosylmethionine:tRNA ribosyltransferase-isomerase